MLSYETLIDPARQGESDLANELARRGNRRRLQVFLIVFLVALAVGLVYTYARPAEYRAQATIAVKTAGDVTPLPAAFAGPGSATVTSTEGGANAGTIEAEAGLLTSRPLIEEALATLRRRGAELPEFGTDPVQGIQAALAAEPVAGTNYIRLTATGPEPHHLASLLNALIDAYSQQMLSSYTSSASTEIETLRQELASLDQRLAEKRKALEDFRESADIVSAERDENQILARVKGLAASLNQANEKLAEAEGRARSLRESLAAGKSVVRARDNPTLASLESRASQLRETLREHARTYTQEFMDMDPDLRGMRLRLNDLEAQLAEERGRAGKVSLAEAEDELAAARQVQARLQKQLAEDRAAVHAFSRTFSAFKAMQEDLQQGEASRRSLSERLLRTETSEMSRMPSVQVVEPATPPAEAWRPDYSRDAGISLGVALVLGLSAMGVVELFNRPPRPSNAPVILSQPWIAVGHDLPPGLAGRAAAPHLPQSPPPAAQLTAPMDAARELSQAEVAALLQALPDEDLVWAGLSLCGATADEARSLGVADLDRGSASIRLLGARTLPLPPGLFERLESVLASAGGDDAAGVAMPASDDECKRRLLCAAHDAGLEDPAGITPQTLRHTCIAYLVRQGLRFSDLDRVVGTLPADVLGEYAALSPAGPRKTLAQIDPLMPALSGLDAG